MPRILSDIDESIVILFITRDTVDGFSFLTLSGIHITLHIDGFKIRPLFADQLVI